MFCECLCAHFCNGFCVTVVFLFLSLTTISEDARRVDRSGQAYIFFILLGGGLVGG